MSISATQARELAANGSATEELAFIYKLIELFASEGSRELLVWWELSEKTMRTLMKEGKYEVEEVMADADDEEFHLTIIKWKKPLLKKKQ